MWLKWNSSENATVHQGECSIGFQCEFLPFALNEDRNCSCVKKQASNKLVLETCLSNNLLTLAFVGFSNNAIKEEKVQCTVSGGK